jgi:CRISPR-associated protein Cmr6
MADACREIISHWWDLNLDKKGENAGLLRDKYLKVAVKDKKRHPEARRKLFEAMCQSLTPSNEIYQAAYERQESTFVDIGSKGFFRIDGRMVIGLGGENVLEAGLTLNHMYGTPIIPGTTLKGLAAHYCHQAWGATDNRFKMGGEYHRAIFGTSEDSGHIIFYDAWITPETLNSSIQPDVMTPHHGDYYSAEKGNIPPTDFDDPNPVTFLSVVGTFQVAVSCDVQGPEGLEWSNLVFGLLSDALREWGIGGKTNAGYGRLIRTEQSREGYPVRMSKPPAGSPKDSGRIEQRIQLQTTADAKSPKYKRGDILEVTRIADPKVKRGRPYFIADDGIGGLVSTGNPPSIEIGQKAQLKVDGVMKEGFYVFSAVLSERRNQHHKRVWKE